MITDTDSLILIQGVKHGKINTQQRTIYELFHERKAEQLLNDLRQHYYNTPTQPQTALDIARWKGGLDVITDMLQTVDVVKDLIDNTGAPV